jgi:hypothetical protein
MNNFMRIIALIILVAGSIVCAYSQTRPEPQKWTANITVVDETGKPVSGAKIIVSFAIPYSSHSDRITGITDTNGTFACSHTDRSLYLSFQVEKEGYYPFGIQHDMGYSPEKYPGRLSPAPTLVLKRIIKQIPMYAKSVNLGVPALDTPVGFDLKAGDWVEPYGRGVSKHVIFTAQLNQRADNDADYKLVVSFPNKGDGIQPFAVPQLPVGQGSGLRSPQTAPFDGYEPEWVQTRNRKPGKSEEGNQDANRNYFIRVETVLDENENVKKALYGKIYGDFMQFRYYLNPTPNDRNIEFDPKQNLLGNLKSFEQVREP